MCVIFPVNTMAPVPAGSTTKSPFVSVVIVPSAVMFRSPILNVPVDMSPDTVTLPVALIAAVVAVPVTVKVPSISVASFICTAEESDESNVVPFTLNALITTSPVPPGDNTRSEFELVEIVSSLIVILSITAVPLNVAAPVTANVLDKVVAPVTASVDAKLVAPETLTASFN